MGHRANARPAPRRWLMLAAILAAGLGVSGCPPAQTKQGPTSPAVPPPPKMTITIRAFIDGRDRLVIRGSTLQWQHLEWAAVGRHGGRNEPTFISTTLNGHPVMERVAWVPEWNEPPPYEIRYRAESSAFESLRPALPSADVTVALEEIAARASVAIVQYPDEGNDYTLIMEFNDSYEILPDWYEVRLVITPVR